MGKSVRINVSLPEQLHSVYSEVAERTGVSLPQVLVNSLASQAAYTRRWIANWNYRPHDRSLVDSAGPPAALVVKAIDPPAKPAGLSRQQRREQQRLLKKIRR